jgi:hypothetical protein
MSGSQVEQAAMIERMLALTRSARERAQAGDWNAVVALEAERRPLIRSFFAAPLPAQGRVRVASAIREMLSSDAGLIALAAAGRDEAAAESRKLRRGRAATAAYAATGTRQVRSLPQAGKNVPPAPGTAREVTDLP